MTAEAKTFRDKYAADPQAAAAPINALLKAKIEGLGKPLDQVKVLDWGCGRGALLAQLTRLGCQAYGTELDPQHVEALQSEHGPDRIHQVDQDNRTPFDDCQFDVIVFHHVFEHVQNQDRLVAEIRRILAPEGLCLTTFPAHLCVFEPHTKIPLAHYFAKGSGIRNGLIWLSCQLGLHALWHDLPKTRQGRYQVFKSYLDTKTNYRSLAGWRTLSARHGLSFDLVTGQTAAMRRLAGRMSVLAPLVMGPLAWLLQTFMIVHAELRWQTAKAPSA